MSKELWKGAEAIAEAVRKGGEVIAKCGGGD